MAQGPPRVPFSPPRWIYGDTLLFGAAGMVVASLSPISAGVLRDPDGYPFRASYQGVICALFFGTLLALLVLTARSVLAALGCALIGGPLVGALTGAAGSVCFWVTQEREVSILASTLGSIPPGALLGVALACAGGVSATFGRRPAHDDFDRLLVALGTWWTLRDWNQVPAIEGLIPLFGASALACDAVLVHVASPSASPYRCQAVESAVLLAPGPGREA
jgi:hypothetical protein